MRDAASVCGCVVQQLLLLPRSASLLPPGDHVERERCDPGPGRRRPRLGRPRHAEIATRLQLGDLYPSDRCAEEVGGESVLLLILPDLLLSDKRLFETKRKDQLNALKNLVELNDINQQYKIIDIMLKGLFKVGRLAFSSGVRMHLF